MERPGLSHVPLLACWKQGSRYMNSRVQKVASTGGMLEALVLIVRNHIEADIVRMVL